MTREQRPAADTAGRIMKRLGPLLAGAAIAACSTAAEPTVSRPSCIPDDSCGCRIVVSGDRCPHGGAHFFHELGDGAPLRFDLGQGLVTAIPTRTRTNVFSPGPGDSWTETYRHPGGSVEIRYSPGPGTCPKLAQGEECEYFDIRAQVRIKGPHVTMQYSGIGTCGC